MKIVNNEKFIEWVLEDAEDFYANKEFIIDSLKYKKVLDLEELFNNTGYVPGKLLVNPTESDLEDEFYPGIDCKLESHQDKYIEVKDLNGKHHKIKVR